jgi:hypothetical protein
MKFNCSDIISTGFSSTELISIYWSWNFSDVISHTNRPEAYRALKEVEELARLFYKKIICNLYAIIWIEGF